MNIIFDKVVTLVVAVGTIFGFFKDKNDPLKKTGRLHLKEYAICKKAVIKAHNAFKYFEKYEAEKDIKIAVVHKKKMKAYIKAFYNLIIKD